MTSHLVLMWKHLSAVSNPRGPFCFKAIQTFQGGAQVADTAIGGATTIDAKTGGSTTTQVDCQ